MSDSEDETNLSLDAVFTEAPRPPSPEPTISVYTREPAVGRTSASQWTSIEIRLVGSHPLWGHHLWNASRAFASFLDENSSLYRNRTVLELGAGGGLPGIVTALNGAKSVVLTDYPDAILLENIEHNIHKNVPSALSARVHVKGYIWGKSVEPLLDILPEQSPQKGFDLIIMSDLIFNHSQHDALLQTCEQTLSPECPNPEVTLPCLLVFYTHHRPHLAYRDMEFFDKARERGWICEEILTNKFPPMFPEDPGDEEVRSTVHGWRLVRCSATAQ